MSLPTRLDARSLRYVTYTEPRGDIMSCPQQTNGAAAKDCIGIDTRWWAKTGLK